MVLPKFLTELKRRKVYRAALVYAAVGWMLLEAADVILPRLGLPDWTVNLVLALVLLGFPLAIVFAWIFDISTQGVVRTPPISPESRHHRFSITSIVEFVLIVVLVITVGYLYVDRLSLQRGMVELESAVQEQPEPAQDAVPNPEQYRSIAVLPFADMSEARDQAWFAEGIAEELLIALSQVDELNVMARTSSFAFKEIDKTVAEIADILGVQAVLEGSVRRSRDRVRISAQLIDARSGYHIWSGSYERQLTDIFALQDELARAIVQALQVELGVGPSMPLVAEQTRSPKAYRWFLRGRALYDFSNPQTDFDSIKYFEKAVQADPDYAMALGYLSLARGLSVLWQPFDEVGPETITAYERALALDPEQSEALAIKAWFTQILHHDYETAGKLYLQAMASKENANAMGIYASIFLLHIGETSRAIRLYTEAEKRDPLHAGYKANLAHILLVSGDAEAAARKAREAIELNPQHVIALFTLIQAYTHTGDFPAAEALLEDIPPALQENFWVRVPIAQCYAAQGNYDKAREIYRDLVDNTRLPLLTNTSKLALDLGEVEDAIDLMELAVEKNSWDQFWIRTYFRDEEKVRDHPRYLALLKRIGLDDESVAELHRKLSFD